ncbi:MAG: penicillin acylase family protein, partial [Gemmobacter sp.]
MGVVFRWLLRIFTGLVVVAALAVGFLYHVLSRSIPDYGASLQVAGLTAPVEIVRSAANVPHIFGATDGDVFFGLGFAHAQDRLWQMTLLRRTAQGRLSELFGARTAKIDELIRRLDLYGAAIDSVPAQDEPTRVALEAYAAGVNAWIAEVNAGARGRGAPEFFVFPPDIAVWQPADSLAIIKLMGLQLSAHLEAEVLRARVSLLLGPERVRDILPDDPSQGIAALPDFASLFPGLAASQAALAVPRDPLSPFPRLPLAGASNGWAAAPFRSAAGGTLLANDPHLGFTAPAIWYLARLELTTGGVIGGTIPGMPAMLVGRSEALGWGLTSSYLDDQDVMIERVNPDNPEQYLTPEGWKTFQTRRSIVTVAGAEPLTLTLRWTENGPVLPGTHYDLASVTPQGHVAAVAWTLLDRADTSMSAALGIMAAGSVEAGIAAGEGFIGPSQNLFLADRAGIAMVTIGRMPRRDPRHMTEGRLPAPGWVAENRWQGMFDYADNPLVRDPASGIIGNTNNKIVARPFPAHVSHLWGDATRIQRWLRLMRARDIHTRESFIEAQLDTVSPAARTLLPLIGAELWFTGEAAPTGTAERRR